MLKKIYHISPLFILLMSLASPASADFIGLKVGGGVWDFEPSGSFRYQGTTIDLKNDLKLKDERGSYAFIAIEHPIPIIPNIKISQTELATTGSGTVTSVFDFGGTTYSVSDTIQTEMDLSHSDVTLYYEILDNVVSLDLGLTAKTFDGKASVTSSGVTESTLIDATIPMLYAAVGLTIPATDISFIVEGSALSVGDASISDITTKVSYESSLAVGIEAGVRTIAIEFDNLDNQYSNMDFSGAFANLFIHF